MGLSRTVSEIYGDFSRKSQNFPNPLYFAPPLKGFPLELGTGAGGRKTRMMRLPSRQRTHFQIRTTNTSPENVVCFQRGLLRFSLLSCSVLSRYLVGNPQSVKFQLPTDDRPKLSQANTVKTFDFPTVNLVSYTKNIIRHHQMNNN